MLADLLGGVDPVDAPSSLMSMSTSSGCVPGQLQGVLATRGRSDDHVADPGQLLPDVSGDDPVVFDDQYPGRRHCDRLRSVFARRNDTVKAFRSSRSTGDVAVQLPRQVMRRAASPASRCLRVKSDGRPTPSSIDRQHGIAPLQNASISTRTHPGARRGKRA